MSVPWLPEIILKPNESDLASALRNDSKGVPHVPSLPANKEQVKTPLAALMIVGYEPRP